MRLGLLLVPQPVLSLAFIAAMRAELVAPSYIPMMLLALFPFAVTIGAAAALRRSRAATGRPWILLGLGIIELGWAVATLAIVGFAIALRSG